MRIRIALASIVALLATGAVRADAQGAISTLEVLSGSAAFGSATLTTSHFDGTAICIATPLTYRVTATSGGNRTDIVYLLASAGPTVNGGPYSKNLGDFEFTTDAAGCNATTWQPLSTTATQVGTRASYKPTSSALNCPAPATAGSWCGSIYFRVRFAYTTDPGIPFPAGAATVTYVVPTGLYQLRLNGP